MRQYILQSMSSHKCQAHSQSNIKFVAAIIILMANRMMALLFYVTTESIFEMKITMNICITQV